MHERIRIWVQNSPTHPISNWATKVVRDGGNMHLYSRCKKLDLDSPISVEPSQPPPKQQKEVKELPRNALEPQPIAPVKGNVPQPTVTEKKRK